MKTVLCYRNDLLPPSETFILAQATSLRRYTPHFVGLRTVPNSLLRHEDCTLAAPHSLLPPRLRPLAYNYAGLRPILHDAEYRSSLHALRPTLMHAHFAPDAAIALPLATALRIPLVVTLHGYDVTVRDSGRNPLRNCIRNHQRSRLQQQAALFLCVSEFIRDQALAAGYPKSKLKVHRIGIDTGIFKPSPTPGRAETVLFVGRLTEKKGCEYLVRAMAAVQRSYPTARLSVIGDGPLRSSLEALAGRLTVNCAFLGLQDSETVRQHIRAARICAVPSVTAANGDSEGLPMFLVEAQGLGAPVVATRHAGIPEGIVDGHAGMLSNERDVDGLAANLLRLLADDALHADLSRRGIALVQRAFDLRKQTPELEAIYDAVVEAATAPSTVGRCLAPASAHA